MGIFIKTLRRSWPSYLHTRYKHINIAHIHCCSRVRNISCFRLKLSFLVDNMDIGILIHRCFCQPGYWINSKSNPCLISLEFWLTKSCRKRMSCISNKDKGFRRKCLRPDTIFSKWHQILRDFGTNVFPVITWCVQTAAGFISCNQALFSQIIFHRNSYPMEISFCYHPSCGDVVTMTACTWHDSFTVVASVNWCSDMIPYNGVTQNPIFHRISISIENLSVKWLSENYRDNHFWGKRMKINGNIQKWI